MIVEAFPVVHQTRPSSHPTRELHDVTLLISDDWRAPWKVIVHERDGALLILNVREDAVPAVREAVMLARVMGTEIRVEVDDTEGLVTRVWSVEG